MTMLLLRQAPFFGAELRWELERSRPYPDDAGTPSGTLGLLDRA